MSKVEQYAAVETIPISFIGEVHAEYVRLSKSGGRLGARYALYAEAIEFLVGRWHRKEQTNAAD